MNAGDRKAQARAEWGGGWTLVLASASGMSLTPLMVYTMGLFVQPLEQEFGWSRAFITSGLMVNAVIGVIFSVFVGMMIDRFGPRRLAILGVTVYCLAFGALSLANGMQWLWWALWFGVAIGSLMVKPTVWTAAIASRFNAARGLALALALSGSGVTGLMAPAIGGYFIENYGWRWGYIGLTAVWLSVALPMLFFFFYGASDLDRKNAPTAAAVKKDKPAGTAIKEAVRSSTFIRMAIASLLIMIVVTAGVVHFIPIVSGAGLPRSEAVTLVSVIGVSAFAGRLVTGSLLDRTNATLVGGIAFMLPALAYFGLAFFDGQIATAIAIAILFGFCSGAELEVASYLSSRIFGMRNFGALFGMIVGLITLGAGMGPPLAGLVYDHFGSYDIALWSAAGMSVVAGLLILSLGSCKPMSATEPAAAGAGR